MSQLRTFCPLRKLISTAFKRRTINSANCGRISGRSAHSDSFNFRDRVTNDVLLYSFEKPRNFIFINAISFGNLIFWTYSGYFFYWTVKTSELHTRVKFFEWLFKQERKYSEILSAVSVTFGVTIFIGTTFFTRRSVRRLLLHKGGKKLTITTYTLWGLNKAMTLPISEVSASLSRKHAKSFIPLKIKNKYFYFLVDIHGEFKNPLLYDCTAGISRNF